MGTVYRAHHKTLKREVAVKVITTDIADGQLHRRLEREARILARLGHPNIVGVFDAGEEGDHVFIAMELVDGVPLSELLPLRVDDALRITALVADALAHAHARGVVHRDIKPSNIFISYEGDVKVGDFGIARLVDCEDNGELTRTNVAVGSPAYMAPEALTGGPPEPAMDIYSLGVVLYQCVQGQLPQGAFAPAPKPVDAIVRRALASDAGDRYASAEAMATALRLARKPSVLKPRLYAPMLAAGASAVVALGVWAPWNTSETGPQERVYRAGLANSEDTLDYWFSDRVAEQAPQRGDYIRTGFWEGHNQQALLRFPIRFGDAKTAVPNNVRITEATLTVAVPRDIYYADGEANAVHQILVPWLDGDTWGAAPWAGGATEGIDVDDVEARAIAADTSERYLMDTKAGRLIPHGATLVFNITSIVEAWQRGEANYGVLLQSLGHGGGNGLFMASSRWHKAALRPTLRVRYSHEAQQSTKP
jgi:hypothetical protein